MLVPRFFCSLFSVLPKKHVSAWFLTTVVFCQYRHDDPPKASSAFRHEHARIQRERHVQQQGRHPRVRVCDVCDAELGARSSGGPQLHARCTLLAGQEDCFKLPATLGSWATSLRAAGCRPPPLRLTHPALGQRKLGPARKRPPRPPKGLARKIRSRAAVRLGPRLSLG